MHFLYSIYYALITGSASLWFYYTDIICCTTNKTLILNNSPHYPPYTGYVGKDTEETVNKKFPGLQKGNHLNWNNHNDRIIPKLCWSHYVFKLMFQASNITQNVKGIYFIQKEINGHQTRQCLCNINIATCFDHGRLSSS
jgi:hypothetical protein